MCALIRPTVPADFDNPQNEIKVIFLGDEGAGKSSIIARILSGDAKARVPHDSFAPDIAISDWTCELNGKRTLVHLWDFCNEEIRYSMYRIFLTRRAFYVVVLNACTDDQEEQARRWLHTIHAAAPNASILLVLNHIDQNPDASIDLLPLRSVHPQLIGTLRMSAFGSDQEAFQEDFLKTLKIQLSLQGLTQPAPESVMPLIKALSDNKRKYITWPTFNALCDTYHIHGSTDRRRMCLDWVQELGDRCCFSPTGQVEDTWLCRPQWITNVLHTLNANPLNHDGNGLLSQQEIYRLLRSPNDVLPWMLSDISYENREIDFIFKLLRHHRLSFDMGHGTEFIPMLCQKRPPYTWPDYQDNEDALELHMEFQHLPHSVIHQLVADMSNDVNPENIWYYGAEFTQRCTGLSALVEGEDNTVIIRAASDGGSGPETLLAQIKENLERISKAFGLRILDQKLAYQQGGLQDLFSYDMLKKALVSGEEYVYSRVFGRTISVREILKLSNDQNEEKIEQLLQDIAQACIEVQHSISDTHSTEDSLNTTLRRALWLRQYRIMDHRLFELPSRSGRRNGEVDVLLMDENQKPWTMIEAMRIRGANRNDLSTWNDHLKLLLQQYDSLSPGIPVLFLISYADCSRGKFTETWEKFCDHIRWYESNRVTNRKGSFAQVELGTPGVQAARCSYELNGRTVTVYHYFVCIGDGKAEQADSPRRTNTEKTDDSRFPPETPELPSPAWDAEPEPAISDPDFYGQDSDYKSGLEIDWDAILDNVMITRGGKPVVPPPQPPVPEPPKPEPIALFEYRVVFLGDSEAGKSQILARVMDPEKGLREFDGMTTPGICLEHQYYDINGHQVRINYWDFGGQEILHSLHRMFLSDRTLYVIVLNTRNDTHDTQADFWMRYVQAYAYGAPVLFVLNKIDQNPRAKLNMPVLNRRFGTQFTEADVLRLNAIEPDCEKFKAEFTDRLVERAAEAIDFSSGFTAQQLAIRTGVEACKGTDRVIRTDTFRNICEDNDLMDEDKQVSLMERFHRAGIVVFFGTDLKMLLDPQWITKAIYAVLEKQDDIAVNGVVPQKKLESLCRRLLGDSDHARFILEVMRYYGLSFQCGFRDPTDLNSENKEFIPMLCRQEEPAEIEAMVQADNTMTMQIHFEYLPTGVLYQLMVHFQDELDRELVWRSGACFRFGSLISAIVRQEGSVMHIYASHETAPARSKALEIMEKLMEQITIIAKRGKSTAKLQEVKIGYTMGTITEFFDYKQLKNSQKHKVYYIASRDSERDRIFIQDILTQDDGAEARLVRQLLELSLKCCGEMQGNQQYWFRHKEAAADKTAPKMDEDARTQLLKFKLDGPFIARDQPRWGSSASGVKSGELDLKIDTREGRSLAILEALNITGDNKTSRDSWIEHLERMMDCYNQNGLRHLLLVSYLDCAKDQIIAVQKAYLELLRTHSVPNYGVPRIITDILPGCSNEIQVVQADYSGGRGDVSVYHFLVHISRYMGQTDPKADKNQQN